MEKDKIYTKLIAFIGIDESGKKIESHGVSIPKEDRRCMFCGRKYPEVKFTKVAHAISETVGNKKLITHFECDDCNLAFGSLLEDSLGKYMAPFKFVSQIYGKKSEITIKDIPHDSALSYDTYRLERKKNSGALDDNGTPQNYIIEKSGTGVFQEIDNGFVLNIPRQKYDPRLVYASFLKMAFSILPMHLWEIYINQALLLGHYARKINPFELLSEQEKYISSLPNKGLFAFVPGVNPLNGVNGYLLYRASKDLTEYPQILFRIDFYNFIICIPVLSNVEQGILKIPYFSFPNAQLIQPLDFTKEEPVFSCEFSASKYKLPKSEYAKLAAALREKNLLI